VKVLLVLLSIVSLFSGASAWSLDVRINDSRDNNFYMDALKWVLDKSGEDYRLVRTEHPISTQMRKVALVQKGEIDVMYAGTTNEMESLLQPIRFPITKGYIGDRIFIINKAFQADYNQVKTLGDLRKFTANLGYGWPEIEIFAASKLGIKEQVYDEIFETIDEGSRYYFPRGILEAYPELITKGKTLKNLAVEKSILLNYQSAVFFFVNPENKELSRMITLGFEKGYKDGSYNKFFYNHPLIKTSFEKANLKNRWVIKIPNPFFPVGSKNIPKKYWH